MKYNNPPIKEAIFDLRIDKLSISSIEEIEKIHSIFINDYPNSKRRINFAGKIEVKGEGEKVTNEADSKIQGFVFSSKDNTRQVQFRLDGFTFNMLSPYSKWDDFYNEAFRLWKIYQKELSPNSITKIALRYINRIKIPLPFNNFQEYITNVPPIPNCLPQRFRNFFMQIDVPCDDNGTNIIITETIEQPNKDFLPFIFDIDVYKIGEFKMSVKDLSKEFLELRNLKNKTFENCITDKTRILFK